MNRSKTCLIGIVLGLLTIFQPFGLQSQSYDVNYTIEYINNHLSDVCQVFSERKGLRVEFYDNGKPVRIDYISPASIDYEEGIYYAEDEGALIISCYQNAGKCIERHILKHGSKLFYDRSNLASKCTAGECKALETAVKHLIMLYVLNDHERTQPFEEN